MNQVVRLLSGRLSFDERTRLIEHVEEKKLEKGFEVLKSGKPVPGIYFLPANLVTLSSHPLEPADSKSVVAAGLQPILLRSNADIDMEVSDEADALFLKADVFLKLLASEEWFRDVTLRLMASDRSVYISSQHLQLEQKRSKLERLVEASRNLNSTLDLDPLLNTILDTSLSSVNGDRGTVYLIDSEKNELWSKVLDGSKSVRITLPLGKGIAGYVAETGETVNIADAQNDPRFNAEVDKRTGYQTRNMLCMPLRDKEGNILGVFQLLNKLNGSFTAEDEQFLDSLSIHAAIAIENARLYEQEQQKVALEMEMSAAADVQRSLFPSVTPKIPGYEIAAHNIPAKDVSGDLYDFITLDDDRYIFTLGDVSGKGMPAAILMANLQSVMRDLPHHNESPAYCSARVNGIIARSSGFDKFITLFVGHIRPSENKLTFTNAGHDYPYLFRADGTIERLESTGIPIGMLAESDYTEITVNFAPGDLLFIYSDGIIDAVNDKNKEFTEERMADLVRQHLDKSPSELIKAVEAELLAFIGRTPQFDDMTMMVLKRSN